MNDLLTAHPRRGGLAGGLLNERQAIRRGSFDTVPQLVAAISRFIDGWNDRCHPFTWTKTADEILPHATRKRISDAGR